MLYLQSTMVNCGLKYYKGKSRSKHFINFKLHYVLRSVTKSAIQLHPTQDTNHPFVGTSATNHLLIGSLSTEVLCLSLPYSIY